MKTKPDVSMDTLCAAVYEAAMGYARAHADMKVYLATRVKPYNSAETIARKRKCVQAIEQIDKMINAIFSKHYEA